ncbi:hypothetical protein V8C86DRAFT_3135851 [Haematococcus lacustris]
MERSRRQPTVSASRAGAKSALEQLKAAREGGGAKRIADFEVEKEEAVYDVVEEEEYARIVAKRKDEGGDFIVDDDGEGYRELGEEDDHWTNRDEEGEEASGREAGKKRKGAKGRAPAATVPSSITSLLSSSWDQAWDGGPSSKRAAAGEGAQGPGGQNIAKLLSKAAARAAIAPASKAIRPSSNEDSDALLDDILGDLGGPPGPDPAAAAAGRAPAVLPRPAPRPHAAAAGEGAARPRSLAGGSAPRPSPHTAYRPPAPGPGPSPLARPPSTRPILQPAPAPSPLTPADDPAPEDVMDMEGPGGEEGGDPTLPVKQEEQLEAVATPPTTKLNELTTDSVTMPASTPTTKSSRAAEAVAAGAAVPLDDASGPQAASGWATMYAEGGGEGEGEGEEGEGVPAVPEGEAEAAAVVEGEPPATDGPSSHHELFYFLDAHENPEARPGEVFLFGKMLLPDPSPSPTATSGQGQQGQQGSKWASVCCVVKGCQRSLLVVPQPDVFRDEDGSIALLEAEVKAEPGRKLELLKLLQERCSAVKAELREVLQRHGIRSFRMVPVKRSYAFEVPGVPHGEQWCLKVRYAATDPALPHGLTGTTFVAIFGANASCLESLVLKRGLKGPSWVRLREPKKVDYGNQISWCKQEWLLDSPKQLLCDPSHPSLAHRHPPPLTVASLSLKTVVNPGNHQHEVVAAAVVHLNDCVSVEAPMARERWNNPRCLKHFSIVRKLEGCAWPPGFEAAVAAQNGSARGRAQGGAMISVQPSERSLLTCLLARLQALDADVLVGHNIGAFDLTVLLTRMQHHKVPLWSRLGRLKRSSFPKLTGGGQAFGGGASAGALSVLAGRLLCDTYLSARELLKEVDYTLKTLARSQLNEVRTEVTLAELPRRFESTQGLLELLQLGECDAWLALGLMQQLAVLPLTKALTNLSGSLWSKTLQAGPQEQGRRGRSKGQGHREGARAQRIEMLLLHEFHARKYILPDKLSFKDKERVAAGKKAAAASGVEEEVGPLDWEEEEGQPESSAPTAAKAKAGKPAPAGSKAKGPQYAGGLVLEPKKGLYDKFVIMLDFNSLYPSIIQEYNICFSTVQRPADGSMPPLPQPPVPGSMAPLPTILQGLVRKRKQAKSAMASARDPVMKNQLNIRQQAIKLTANSMYGCLGFSASRFFARPLAELITSQGRSILQATVDLVQGTIGAEVIYGDTDSIMIYTGSDDLTAVRELGARIKREVNRRYKLLEIELDGIFKCMLLLKKKKYACIKLEPGPNNTVVEVQEQKGLDIVRRDWCPLSKDLGHAALAAILSGRPREEVVEAIHDSLREVRGRLAAGAVPLGKFIITKALTKRLEEYPDARSQPHVQVALRRRAAGKRDGVQAGETVPYIICIDTGTGTQQPAPSTPTPGATANGSTHQATQPTPTTPATQTAPTANGTPAASGVVPGGASLTAVAGLGEVGGIGTPLVASAPAHSSVGGGGGGGAAGGGGLAERAYHPDELRESGGRLVVDVEYYLAQQVHPVVSRLCAPLEGTDPGRLAECLGLDASRFKGPTQLGSGTGASEEDTLLGGGGLLEDDECFKDCAPLLLTSPGGTTFEFQGAVQVAKNVIDVSQLLCPPEAVGDPEHTLSRAALVNQVTLRAREFIARYYDGALVADDELERATDASNNHTGANSLRDVVLRPSGELDRLSHPDPSKKDVLLSRLLSERRLYLQLVHFHRLLNPELAAKRALAQLKAVDPKCKLVEADVHSRLASVEHALAGAAKAVDELRRKSCYHWVSLTDLFGVVARARVEAGAGAAAGVQAAAGGSAGNAGG